MQANTNDLPPPPREVHMTISPQQDIFENFEKIKQEKDDFVVEKIKQEKDDFVVEKIKQEKDDFVEKEIKQEIKQEKDDVEEGDVEEKDENYEAHDGLNSYQKILDQYLEPNLTEVGPAPNVDLLEKVLTTKTNNTPRQQINNTSNPSNQMIIKRENPNILSLIIKDILTVDDVNANRYPGDQRIIEHKAIVYRGRGRGRGRNRGRRHYYEVTEEDAEAVLENAARGSRGSRGGGRGRGVGRGVKNGRGVKKDGRGVGRGVVKKRGAQKVQQAGGGDAAAVQQAGQGDALLLQQRQQAEDAAELKKAGQVATTLLLQQHDKSQ